LRAGGPEVWDGRVSASKGRKMALALGAIRPAMGRKNVEITPRDEFYGRP